MEIFEDSDSGESVESTFDLLEDVKTHTKSDVETLREEVSALRADIEFQKSKAYYSGFNEANRKATIKHNNLQFDLIVIFLMTVFAILLVVYNTFPTCVAAAKVAQKVVVEQPAEQAAFVFEDQVYDDSL